MSTNINDPAYSTLNTYAVLASSGITSVNTTTITNGFYGTPGAIGITGAYIGVLDGANATVAQTQLTALVNAIRGLTITGPPISGGSGMITYFPGRYDSSSIISYSSGTNIILDGQGDTESAFYFTSGSIITFTSISTMTLINGASNCNVFWLAGTAINFIGTSPSNIPGIYIAGSQITFDNGSTILGRLYAQTGNVTFSGTTSINSTCTQNIVCYMKGTLILTEEGYIPIEKIKIGDNVVTKGKIYDFRFIKKNVDLQIEPVIWVSRFKVNHLNTASRPICIKKDTFDENSPFCDLYVSPGHSLLLNYKITVAASIINGKTIYRDNSCNDVEYYHLECPYHSAIFANGVLAESYYDGNNRDAFENVSY
jgi:hypothetical protein